MNKTFKIYAILFVIVLVIIALLQVNKTESTDWRKTFDTSKKSPFGLYIFNHEAQSLFKDKLKKIGENPYNFYEKNQKKSPHNILIIETDIDVESWRNIMNEVSKGSDAMIINQYIPKSVADSIGFYISNFSSPESTALKLTDKKFTNSFVKIDKFPGGRGFTYVKPEVEILGKIISEDADDQAGFIKRKFGKGNFYVHSEPLFLTNYYLLQKGNTQYAQDVFSYLPDRETLWFGDKKSVQSQFFMRFILNNPALRYAWWMLLGGMILFIVFNAKRKQRIVPVIDPLKNSSVDFVKSIGNLYLQEGDFHEMMAKKAQYFLHKVRIDLLIDTKNLDDDFAKKLHLKTGKTEDKINEAIALIKKAQDPYASVMKDDLARMNSLLDEILK
ncbi:hypothetical protein [Chryseobacterium sp.]|uniref:hypothetical protein n=1 Tax=Chryseobacterium sp. TaxID=1871047 RepID=UPI0028A1FA24|nr:hypothetical protein [Chryseobacterium sp.]